MDNPEIWIALVIVGFLIFGAKRMPDAARGLGRSLRIFKAETKGLLTDDEQKTRRSAAAANPCQRPSSGTGLRATRPAGPRVRGTGPAGTGLRGTGPAGPGAAPAPAEQPVPEHRDAQ